MIKRIIAVVLMNCCFLCSADINEFVVSKPNDKKLKRISCSQLKEEIAQHAAHILQVSTEAVGAYAGILEKKLKKTDVQCCAKILEAVACVQRNMLSIISNMINPEKNSVWSHLTREQLSAMHEMLVQYADEIAQEDDDGYPDKLSVQKLAAEKKWWLELQRQVSATLPVEKVGNAC